VRPGCSRLPPAVLTSFAEVPWPSTTPPLVLTVGEPAASWSRPSPVVLCSSTCRR
jgi:hypothetical protein